MNNFTLEDILQCVSNEFAISKEELLSKSHKAKIVKGRYLVMYIARYKTKYPMNKIASFFNQKSHSIVIHACRCIDYALEKDLNLNRVLNACLNTLNRDNN